MGERNASHGTVIDSSEFEIDLELQSKELAGYLFTLTLFYAVFTVTFYVGIPITTVEEAFGGSTKSGELMDMYNTYSGYVMALVEVLIGMYVDTFVPVLRVFLHNKLVFLCRDSSGKPRSRAYRLLYMALLAFLPVVLGLTNSSVKGLQAVQSTIGIKRVMTIDDMKKDVRKSTHEITAIDSILANAIRDQAVPFSFDRNSSCGNEANHRGNASRWIPTVHELASTSAIYGFVPRDWNSEAIVQPNLTSSYTVSYAKTTEALRLNLRLPVPPTFSIQTAYEMLVQGKMVIERAFSDSVTEPHDCNRLDGVGGQRTTNDSSRSKGPSTVPEFNVEVFTDASKNQWGYGPNDTRLCEGSVSSMFKMSDFYSRDNFRVEDLVLDAADVISDTFPNITREDTSITLATYELTPQIRLETMEIQVVMGKGVNFGNQSTCTTSNSSCVPTYSYAEFGNALCGRESCAFVDTSGTFPIQPEIGLMPYYVNCTLDRERIHYSATLRGYFPDMCTKGIRAFFLYGYGSYMTGEAFSMHDPATGSASIVAPRRVITFTFAKVVWRLTELDKKYNAACYGGHVRLDCFGFEYKLQPSGRFLFAGVAALPNDALRAASFHSPIELVKLNSPAIQVDGKSVTIERLSRENFGSYNDTAVQGPKCSLIMDSYLKHVSSNNYFLERPLPVMATSWFYYLMQHGAVTDLKNTSLVMDETPDTNDPFANVRLKGELQMRNIIVSIPQDSYYTTLAGCVGIGIATIVIIFVPVRRVKYFTKRTTKAEQLMAMSKDADYPNDVHDKLLLFPATRDRVRFSDLVIESLVLTHVASFPTEVFHSIQTKELEAPAPDSFESTPETSQATTSEEIA